MARAYQTLLSPEQSRAGRAWLDWTQDRLAQEASVGLSTIKDFESGKRLPVRNNLLAVRRALEQAGLAFRFADDGTPSGIDSEKKGGPSSEVAARPEIATS